MGSNGLNNYMKTAEADNWIIKTGLDGTCYTRVTNASFLMQRRCYRRVKFASFQIKMCSRHVCDGTAWLVGWLGQTGVTLTSYKVTGTGVNNDMLQKNGHVLRYKDLLPHCLYYSQIVCFISSSWPQQVFQRLGRSKQVIWQLSERLKILLTDLQL